MSGKKLVGLLVVFQSYYSLFSQEIISSLLLQDALNFPQSQQRSPFCIAANPATLAYFSHSNWGFSTAKGISIQGWVQGNGVGLLSSPVGNWALVGETTGLQGFRRQQLSISHARKLSEGISLGVSLGVNSFKATGYKMQWRPATSLGSYLRLSEVLSMGFSAAAVFSTKYKREQFALSDLQFLFTLQYEPSSVVCLSWWSLKKNNFSIYSGISLRYQLHSKINLIVGIALNQQLSWLGLSIRRKKIAINLQAGWHPMLGVSNNIFLYGNNK